MYRDRKPARLGQVLSAVLSRRKGLRNGLKSEDIFTEWPSIVGPDLSEKLYPLRVRGRTLTMAAMSAAWAQEAAFLQNQILENIRRKLGDGVVTEIRVQVHGSPPRARDGAARTADETRRHDDTPVPPDQPETGEDHCPETLLRRLHRADEHVKKWRKAQGWPECPVCGVHFPPGSGEEACPVCRRIEIRRQREEVRRLVEEAPWMTPQHLMHETGVEASVCRAIRDEMEAYWRARVAEGLESGSPSSRRFPGDFRRRVLQLMMLDAAGSSPELNRKRVDEVCGPGTGQLFFDTEEEGQDCIYT